MLVGDINSHWIGKLVEVNLNLVNRSDYWVAGRISMITMKKNGRVIIRFSDQKNIDCSPTEIIQELPE